MVALQLGDCQLQMRDQRLIDGAARAFGGEFTFPYRQLVFGFHQLRLHRRQQAFEGLDIIGGVVRRGYIHARSESQIAPI